LALDEASVVYLPRLSPIHRDPFDRLLICQANVHDLSVMTDDEIIRKYPVKAFA
jgi:PIN domain nuclease of toxin-antitoxin system